LGVGDFGHGRGYEGFGSERVKGEFSREEGDWVKISVLIFPGGSGDIYRSDLGGGLSNNEGLGYLLRQK